MTAERGRLIVVSGPSGAGKSTVIGRVMKRRSDVCFSVSATTRDRRPGEEDGVDYFFVSRPRFEEMIAGGELLEHAEYVGNCYGTPAAFVDKKLDQGITVILDIEVQGAAQVREHCADAIGIFILPPSAAELERRLRGRNTDSEEKIQQRLIQARRECEQAYNYGYIVINDDPEIAANEVDSIITAEKCRAEKRINLISEVLSL